MSVRLLGLIFTIHKTYNLAKKHCTLEERIQRKSIRTLKEKASRRKKDGSYVCYTVLLFTYARPPSVNTFCNQRPAGMP